MDVSRAGQGNNRDRDRDSNSRGVVLVTHTHLSVAEEQVEHVDHLGEAQPAQTNHPRGYCGVVWWG